MSFSNGRKCRQCFSSYARRGGNVTVGSDAGFIYQLYGFCTIRELELQHRNLDTAVSRLGRRAYLTPGEQREFADLKKQKLMTKDQLAALRR